MNNLRTLSTRIEKEYDPIRNVWETRVQFILHQDALYSGFLAEIPPHLLHSLVCLSLFMNESGKIEISVADFARALGISLQLAQKRIEELAAFRFQEQPIVHINKTRVIQYDEERVSLSILPISPITFVDERDEQRRPTFTAKNSDYLYEYFRMMLGVEQLAESDKELLATLQGYPYELPPQVIEVLIEHVMEYKKGFDRQYLMTIAHSWSVASIITKDQALQWIKETKTLSVPTLGEDSSEKYLLQFLRDRIRREPSAVQINIILQLLEEPFQLEPGCVEALIDHVTSHFALTKGKPDFPKNYVEAVVQDWQERGIRTRTEALQAIEEWKQKYAIKPADATGKSRQRKSAAKRQDASNFKSDYLDKLRKAGLK
ncbi:DnaD domain protein [Effusibacillus dendaii]|uniref:DnaB/C C-terminal domain-containing protein n=1 Tax=Effusibacillus dendaii TaxID=2743772 RepID=A0A7I8DBZ2_9BACL|nr:DnaD domain protein [Effusibacillus dendaii]BCJ85441.1 hypothetical protein skT53_04260 [Effusibacillus dendaii]